MSKYILVEDDEYLYINPNQIVSVDIQSRLITLANNEKHKISLTDMIAITNGKLKGD